MTYNGATMRGLLIDLDGTVYHGTRMIQDADALIAYLKHSKLPYRFVTNNSSASPAEVANRLTAMGIPAVAGDICTSAQAAANYIASRSSGASVFAIGEAGLKEALEQAGLVLADSKPDFVVQGIDRFLAYDRIAQAVRYIREGAEYILTNPDLLLPSTDGLIPGAGAIGAMLEAASGVKPTLIGKPSSILMAYALEQLELEAGETWVVGDNLATDIAAGVNAGCGTALVLTGLTNRQNYEAYALAAGCTPDLICEHLAALIEAIKAYR